MPNFSVWYNETYTYKGFFSANSREEALEMLDKIRDGEADLEYLPEFFSKDKNYDLEIDLLSLEGDDIEEKNMVNNTITVVGSDTSVGEVVESFMDNDSINDETLYTVESVDVYGLKNDVWNRLTGADIEIQTENGVTNRYIDPIREQFPAVDIEVVGVND